MTLLKKLCKIFFVVAEIVYTMIQLKIMIIKGIFTIANIIVGNTGKHKSKA